MQKSIYDHPKWYDLVYGSDWKAEFDFLIQCFDVYGISSTKTLFEPACGTGRLLYRLAKKGFEVSGNDLSKPAIDYCNARLKRNGFAQSTCVGDMCDFELNDRVDAAFNLVSSFRHIIDQKNALRHLKCMSDCLKPGGLYVLGFHLTPTAVDSIESESWSASRGHLTVNTSMKLVGRDWDQRVELYETNFDIYTPTSNERIESIVQFQMYTLEDFKKLLKKVPEFDIVETYDFHFDFEEPVALNDEIEDTVFVLKKN